MEKDDKDEKDDHQDDGTWGRLNTEQSNQTNDGKISASRGLLQSPGINKTLGVDMRVEDE